MYLLGLLIIWIIGWNFTGSQFTNEKATKLTKTFVGIDLNMSGKLQLFCYVIPVKWTHIFGKNIYLIRVCRIKCVFHKRFCQIKALITLFSWKTRFLLLTRPIWKIRQITACHLCFWLGQLPSGYLMFVLAYSNFLSMLNFLCILKIILVYSKSFWYTQKLDFST